MSELPWFKFIIAHWMLDRNLAKCSPATRGVWLELIIAMHQDDRSGELRETVDHMAQLARTTTVVMTQALTELQTTGTADVTFRNEIVTVVNRKMKREAKGRISTNLRVKKHRSNKNVTPGETVQSKEVRVKSKEEESNTTAPSAQKMPIGLAPEMVASFKELFPKYPINQEKDFTACLTMAYEIGKDKGITRHDITAGKSRQVLDEWLKIVAFVASDKWFKTRAISDLANEWQRLMQSYAQSKPVEQPLKNQKSVIENRTEDILSRFE